MRDLRSQNAPDQFRLCLLNIDSDGQTVFSLAAFAFPDLSEYQSWLSFLSEVFAVPVSDVAQYPHLLLTKGFSQQMQYPEELFQQVTASVTPPSLNTLMEKRFGDWVKYIHASVQSYPVSAAVELAQLNREQSLSYLLEMGYDCNFMSGNEPVWVTLARLPVNCWALIRPTCLFYRKENAQITQSFEEFEGAHTWLELVHSSPYSIAPALHCCLEGLKSRSADYTKMYLNALLDQPNSYDLPPYARLKHAESLLPSELDSESPAYCGALVLLLDYAVYWGVESLFFDLVTKPHAQEVVLHPQSFYRSSGFKSVLKLNTHSCRFNENVNQAFIGNSFLYLALSSSCCKASIVKKLLQMGCPLLNPELAHDQHDFHPLFALLRRSTVNYFGMSWLRYRLQPRNFFQEEATIISELGFLLLATQNPAYDSEAAVGLDVSLDSEQHKKETTTRTWERSQSSRIHPELLRLVLPTGRLFGSIYSFSANKVSFWTSKTLQLLLCQTRLGLNSELRQTTSQLNSFLPAAQVPLRVADIVSEQAANTTGLVTSETLTEQKFRLEGSRNDVLQHAEALRTLLNNTCFLRLEKAPNMPWLEKALRQVCNIPELFLHGSSRQPLVVLKEFFQAFRAFQRHSCTTLLHYLAKNQSLVCDLTTALQSSARFYAHCLDRKGRSPLTMAARAGNLEAVDVLLQAAVPVPPGALFLALQGPAHSLTSKLSPEEETIRLQIFQRLFAKISQCEGSGEDLSGYDSLFSQEKGLMQGSEMSLGYPVILACARYSEAGVRQLLALGLSACLIHLQKLPKKVRESGHLKQSSHIVPTCALKEALKRKDCSLARLIYSELASKYPLTFSKQP